MSLLSRLSLPLRIFVIVIIFRLVYIAPQQVLDVLHFRYNAPRIDHAISAEQLSLSREECAAAFPGLTSEIDVMAAHGAFELERMPGFVNQHIQGRISNGKVREILLILDLLVSFWAVCLLSLAA